PEEGGEVKLWDAQTGRAVRTLKSHTKAVYGGGFSPDGKRLAAGIGACDTHGKPLPGEVKLWDTETGEEVLSLKGHTREVVSVCFSPDGKRLASAGGGEVKVWDAEQGTELLSLPGHTGGANSVSFSPDGKRLASACADRTVKVWAVPLKP